LGADKLSVVGQEGSVDSVFVVTVNVLVEDIILTIVFSHVLGKDSKVTGMVSDGTVSDFWLYGTQFSSAGFVTDTFEVQIGTFRSAGSVNTREQRSVVLVLGVHDSAVQNTVVLVRVLGALGDTVSVGDFFVLTFEIVKTCVQLVCAVSVGGRGIGQKGFHGGEGSVGVTISERDELSGVQGGGFLVNTSAVSETTENTGSSLVVAEQLVCSTVGECPGGESDTVSVSTLLNTAFDWGSDCETLVVWITIVQFSSARQRGVIGLGWRLSKKDYT
jgi:hypothetical protein